MSGTPPVRSKHSASRSRSAPTHAIEERIALYSRYAAVMREQEAALDRNDLDRFSQLNETRSTIQAEVASMPLAVEQVPDPATLEAIRRAVAALENVSARQARMEARLKSLRSEVAADIGDVKERRGHLRTYLEDEELGAVEQRPRIDVRS